jgi:hypothetical protein
MEKKCSWLQVEMLTPLILKMFDKKQHLPLIGSRYSEVRRLWWAPTGYFFGTDPIVKSLTCGVGV